MMTGFFGRKARQAMELIHQLKGLPTPARSVATPVKASLASSPADDFVPMTKVDRILIMMGQRPWDAEPVRLMTNLLSPARVNFRSDTRFGVGDEMHLQILLGHCTLEMEARVTSALIVEGECRGELALMCSFFEREKIRDFTKRFRSLESI
ncbi:MAG: hypothetical protein AMXMBFR33_20090 [Candidatus Xenobia bacterium]|jgi:hypothetical protein